MLLLSQESCFWMEACAWQGVGHGVDASGHLLGGSDLCCWQHFGVLQFTYCLRIRFIRLLLPQNLYTVALHHCAKLAKYVNTYAYITL